MRLRRMGRPLYDMNSSANAGSEIEDCSVNTASLTVVTSEEARRGTSTFAATSFWSMVVVIVSCNVEESLGDRKRN